MTTHPAPNTATTTEGLYLGFPTMADVVPQGESGNVAVEHYHIGKTDVMLAAFRDRWAYTPTDRTYTKLVVGGQLVMSDTAMERSSNRAVVAEARGHVYVAGLGLGMIIHAILAKPEVASLTVVEINPHVIALIGPTLPNDQRLAVIEADAFAWKPAKGVKYDVIYFDIWPDRCTDNLDDLARLKRRLTAHKAPGVWCHGWMEDDLRYQRRSGL